METREHIGNNTHLVYALHLAGNNLIKVYEVAGDKHAPKDPSLHPFSTFAQEDVYVTLWTCRLHKRDVLQNHKK